MLFDNVTGRTPPPLGVIFLTQLVFTHCQTRCVCDYQVSKIALSHSVDLEPPQCDSEQSTNPRTAEVQRQPSAARRSLP